MIVYSSDKRKKTVANTTRYFMNEIFDRLKKQGWHKDSVALYTVIIKTDAFDYCTETISILEKTFDRFGWECKMYHFFKRREENSFSFSIKKRS